MKTTNLILISLMVLFMSSCKGDKKTIIGEDLSDDSFVNTNFKGNLIDYSEDMSACNNFSKSVLSSNYEVTDEDVTIRDSSIDERFQSLYPKCKFTVMLGEGNGYLLGEITVIPEAQQTNENWKETWAITKAASKSAEWVKNVGMAAQWKPNNRELSIKFEGYTLKVVAPGLNYDPNNQDRNNKYKNTALAIAKSAGYID